MIRGLLTRRLSLLCVGLPFISLAGSALAHGTNSHEKAGTFEFACLIAGHYQAGMKGTIVVAPLLRNQAHTARNALPTG